MIETHRTLADLGGDGTLLAALKASPGLAVMTGALAGMTIETWVAILTILYLLIVIAEKLWKWRRAARGDDNA